MYFNFTNFLDLMFNKIVQVVSTIRNFVYIHLHITDIHILSMTLKEDYILFRKKGNLHA